MGEAQTSPIIIYCFLPVIARNVFVGLVVGANHDGAGLDHCVCGAANLQAQFLDGSHGDVGADDIATADVDLDVAVDCTFDDFNNSALELISCAKLHNFIFLSKSKNPGNTTLFLAIMQAFMRLTNEMIRNAMKSRKHTRRLPVLFSRILLIPNVFGAVFCCG